MENEAAIQRSDRVNEGTCGEPTSVDMDVDEEEYADPENSNSRFKNIERNKTISAAKVENLKDQMKYLLNRHRLLEHDVYEVKFLCIIVFVLLPGIYCNNYVHHAATIHARAR